MLHYSAVRLKAVILGVIILILLKYTALSWRNIPGRLSLTWGSAANIQTGHIDLRPAQLIFWHVLEELMSTNAPGCPAPGRLDRAGVIGYNAVDEIVRPQLMTMPEEDVNKMQQAHDSFVTEIMSHSSWKPIYNPKTRGVVSTAGGMYLPVLVISLRMLRRTGSILPMEVFLASQQEYEEYICEQVLPSLNARCIILSQILDAVVRPDHAVTIQQYQLKSFAMLFSSFEEILFIDADCFPIHDPNSLFESEPFTSHGMITWPDYWANTASSLYYSISSQTVPSTTKRASSETGEILLSKKTHSRSLLLTTYYNYYGPTHYYPLLSQGAPGEGDKETFLAAAIAMNESVYTTSERVSAIGNIRDNGEFIGSAMVQRDPIQDYKLTKQGLWRARNESIAEAPRPFFIHANFPKFNPATIFSEDGLTRYSNGTSRRVWTDQIKIIRSFDYDVEKRFWEEIKWTACELEHRFRSWTYGIGICETVKHHWAQVFVPP
ncbi:hypothetical protein MMC06_005519 [Schaereria dolodes]|nr:hypothetical protein [Schaereria dolodes]